MKLKRAKGNTIPGLNTGEMIRGITEKRNLNNTEIGRKTGRTESTIKALLKKTSVQVYVLWEFSLALKHNFFADLAHQLDEAAGNGVLENRQAGLTTRLAALEKENSELRTERDYLRKVVDVLGMKEKG